MTVFTYDINQLEFCVANIAQVKRDFSGEGNTNNIFINDMSLTGIYKEMNLQDNSVLDLQDADLSRIWKQYCFKNVDEKQFPYWQKFANALFHQGGLLYAFEAALKKTMSMPDKNSKAYFSEKTEKKVYINFDKQGLIIQENCTFIELKDSSGDKENNIVAKNGNYLIKAELLHQVTIIEKNGELRFQHEIKQPEFKCKNLDLQKCLNQKRLSIMGALKNIISKIFRLKPEPNRPSFFQKPCYQAQISQNEIILKDDDTSNILQNRYTKVINHG